MAIAMAMAMPILSTEWFVRKAKAERGIWLIQKKCCIMEFAAADQAECR